MKIDHKGFTIVELAMIILIIGVLTTILACYALKIRERAYITAVKMDLSAAYKAALSYHTEHTDDDVTVVDLIEYGYRQTKDVDVHIEDGSLEDLEMWATHPAVLGRYKVESNGSVSKM